MGIHAEAPTETAALVETMGKSPTATMAFEETMCIQAQAPTEAACDSL